VTKSEELLARQARYNRIERADDAFGRSIGVRILKRSQSLRIEEMAPNLTGDEPVFDESTGKTVYIPKIGRLLMAASVCEIDGSPVTFPKDRRELDAVLDMLEDEGLAAVAEAMMKLNPAPPKDEDVGQPKDQTDAEAQAAKN
jgi:hypothetical protein